MYYYTNLLCTYIGIEIKKLREKWNKDYFKII